MKPNLTSNDLLEFIKEWNLRYPYDRYFRKKYNIIFGSEQHKQLNFLDMAIDLKEDLIFTPKHKSEADNMDREEFEAQTGAEFDKGENQEQPMSKMEIDSAYENLDIDQFNSK